MVKGVRLMRTHTPGRKMKEKVEVKEVSEREIWVGENRLYLGEDNIIYITNVGEINEKTAVAIEDAVIKLTTMVERNVSTLTDLNKAGKMTPKARKVFQEFVGQGEHGKAALFGMHPVARVLASFFMGVTRKRDIRFFKKKEEALSWLKE
jgi:hypothetical protein